MKHILQINTEKIQILLFLILCACFLNTGTAWAQTIEGCTDSSAYNYDSGATFDDIVDVSVFLTDMKSDFNKFNKIYSQYFKKSLPTRTTVEVLSLPTPIAVELKIIAFINEK